MLEQFFASGVNTKAELQQNAAKWHRSCYLKYNATELKRAQKRKSETVIEQSESPCQFAKLTRSQINTFDPKSYACFFCEQAALPGTLFNVSTFNLDRKCVDELKDACLIAKISGPEKDLMAKEAKYHVTVSV